MFFYSIIRRISSSSQAEGGTTKSLKKNKTHFSKFSLIDIENFEKQLNAFFFPKTIFGGEKKNTLKSQCFAKLNVSRTTANSLQTSNTENLHRAHSSTRQSIEHMDYL